MNEPTALAVRVILVDDAQPRVSVAWDNLYYATWNTIVTDDCFPDRLLTGEFG
jgi:hypothetical protein